MVKVNAPFLTTFSPKLATTLCIIIIKDTQDVIFVLKTLNIKKI